jgi:hypothetical protein
MVEINPCQDPEQFPLNTKGNGLRPPSREEKQGTRSRLDQPASRKATGPRTVQGKKRNKFNALKHGLLSKFVLLEGESRAEYVSLLNGLSDYWQPQGKMESVEVENLAVLLWRKRRLLQAENAEISERMKFTGFDYMERRRLEAWEDSRAAKVSGGLLKNYTNPRVIREAKETFELIRFAVDEGKIWKCLQLVTILYGVYQEKDLDQGLQGGTPHGFPTFLRAYAELAEEAEKQGNEPVDPGLKKLILAMIDAKIEHLEMVEKTLNVIDQEKMKYKSLAAVIPGQEESDHLLRYETHFSREIDRTLNRLERLQRIRKGQPLPPQVDVRIS